MFANLADETFYEDFISLIFVTRPREKCQKKYLYSLQQLKVLTR